MLLVAVGAAGAASDAAAVEDSKFRERSTQAGRRMIGSTAEAESEERVGLEKLGVAGRGTPLGCGWFRILGTLLVVLSFGVVVSCGSEEGSEAKAIPSSPEEAGSVSVRVSGAEGVAYSGDYGSLGADTPEIVEGVLEGDPVEYEVEIQDSDNAAGLPGGVTAFFRKTQPGTGRLTVEIVADDETVAESTTYAEQGAVSTEWLPEPDVPPGGDLPPDGGIPEEDIFGEEPPPPEEDNP